jgi:hypothetical protein
MNTHVTVRIGAVGDPVLFPDLKVAGQAELVGLGILAKGTAKGNCSATLLLKTADGVIHACEMTANMLITLGASARGAKERFGDTDL